MPGISRSSVVASALAAAVVGTAIAAAISPTNVATILERCGADVRTASSAAEGMAAILRNRPDVLISDIEMPHEDGYSFMRRVRALPTEKGGRLPAAALTAYASAADRMKVLSAGFNIHMAKPIQPAELAVVVANLSGRQVRQV